MKQFTEQMTDDVIRLKFGALVAAKPSMAFVNDQTLGKIFKCSASKIRKVYTERFAKNREREMPLLERLQVAKKKPARKIFGYRFLRQDQIDWLTSSETLRRHTAMSLADRTKDFLREF